MLHDYFGAEVAASYDDSTDVRFTSDHLALESLFLAQLAGPGGRALELAIGTGRVALPLAERGIDVAGIDLSESMVAELRNKPGGADVHVVIGDYTNTRVAGEFDLVYLVFNTIGNAASQDAQVATFENAARHLRPGGCFVIEIGTPGVLLAQADHRYRVFDHGGDHVGIDEYDVATQLMWSHHYVRRDDGSYRRNSLPFRYASPAEFDLMARIAGMRLRERWGWWDKSTFTADSRSHVSVWEKHRS